MEWLEPWEPVGDEKTVEGRSMCDAWERELRTEVAGGHVLYGVNTKLIARRYDCDDALYRLDDGRVAKVHLTWKQASEIAPRWPETTIYPSLEHWATTGQRRDNAEWNGDYSELFAELGD